MTRTALWGGSTGAVLSATLGALILTIPQSAYLADRAALISAPAAAAASAATGALVGLCVWWLLKRPSEVGDRLPPLRRVALTSLLTIAAAAVLVLLRPQTGTGFVTTWLWGLLLLLAMVGWGRLVEAAVLPGRPELGWGLRAALGMALAVAIGGLLNLTWTISRPGVAVLVGLGAAVALAGARCLKDSVRISGVPTARLVLILGVVLLVAVQYTGSIAGSVQVGNEAPGFDIHDDRQAYLVFPERMLQLGSIGAEPFEARRMLSLGGQSLLQALVLVGAPIRALHLVDAGIAVVILAGLVVGAGRRRGTPAELTILVLLILLALPHLSMRGNTSAVLTGTVLMLAWYRLLADRLLDDLPLPRQVIAPALALGALCALKTTFVPAAVVMLGLSVVLLALRSGRPAGAVGELAASVAVIVLVTAPWAISVYESNGTPLYPLGEGFYGGVYTDDFAHIAGGVASGFVDRVRGMIIQGVPLLPTFLLLLFLRERSPRSPAAVLAVAAAVSVVALVTVGEPSLERSLSRYFFPIATAALVAALLEAFGAARDEAMPARLGVVVGVVVGVSTIIGWPQLVRDQYLQLVRNVVAAVEDDDVVTPTERTAVAELQASVPPGTTLLTTLRDPYLLDFRRNRVYTMSLPGQSSPPPGLPVFAGGEAVAGYLVDHGIGYVAYSGLRDLRRVLDLTEDHINERYPDLKVRWVLLRYHRKFRGVVEELAGSRRRLYSGGNAVALDLRERVTTYVVEAVPARVDGVAHGVWSTGATELADLECPPEPTTLALRLRGWLPAGVDPLSLEPVLVADGRELPLIERIEDGLVFEMPQGIEIIETLRLTSGTWRPVFDGELGPARLGLDLHSVEIGSRPDCTVPTIQRVLQPVSGALDPARALERSGFFPDFNWTTGDAVIAGLDWPADGASRLAVDLYPAHPRGQRPRSLDVEVVVNGIELAAAGEAPHRLEFHLYRGIERIERVRIRSSTFVPLEIGTGEDARRLGIPVKRLRLER